MRRFALLLTLAAALAVLGAAASTSPTQLPPAHPMTAGIGQASAPAQVRWLDTYGTFDVHRGTWNFFPKPEGC